jgi:hypothetical protein
MQRNALVVLGNHSGPLTAEQRARVEAIGDDDAPVAAAARRLLRRRG